MSDPGATVVAAITMLLARRAADDVAIEPGSAITEDLGLDSLEVAELSAILEDDLGSDPYSEGVVPRTVGELVSFYAT